MAQSMKLGGGGRFAKLTAKLAERGAENPAALSAYIGRKKYGSERFAKLSAAGRHRAAEARHGGRA